MPLNPKGITMATIISSFYNRKFGKAETVLTPLIDKMTLEDARKYIDNYLPVKFRMVKGEDSLNVMVIDADLVVNSSFGMTKREHHEKL